MKFDVERALRLAMDFGFQRLSGSEEEREAADRLDSHLKNSGWKVERVMTRAGCRFPGVMLILFLTWFCTAYLLWRALRLSFPTWPKGTRLGLFLIAFLLCAAWLRHTIGRHGILAARRRFGLCCAGHHMVSKSNVVASRQAPHQASARILILSHLDTPLAQFERWDRFILGLASGLLLILCLAFSPILAAWCAVGIGFALIELEARSWFRQAPPSEADNRTGLALLAELGETLESRTQRQIEIYLVAVSGGALGQFGALSLSDALGKNQQKSTLVVNLDSPGLGKELVLVGTGEGLEFARAAAVDLWIPHRVSRSAFCSLDHRPFQFQRIPSVSLTGSRRGGPIDPASLAATAQLVMEMAWRWAKQAGHSPPPDSLNQEETPARSVQNPG